MSHSARMVHLRGVTDGLSASENEIRRAIFIADLADGNRQHTAGRRRVGSSESAIGGQHGQRLA